VIYRPYKRVGEPSSFKGIKGPYLFLALYYCGGILFSCVIILILPIPQSIQLSVIALLVGFLLIKINKLKKLSKYGDIHKVNKDRCRKNIHIKSK